MGTEENERFDFFDGVARGNLDGKDGEVDWRTTWGAILSP